MVVLSGVGEEEAQQVAAHSQKRHQQEMAPKVVERTCQRLRVADHAGLEDSLAGHRHRRTCTTRESVEGRDGGQRATRSSWWSQGSVAQHPTVGSTQVVGGWSDSGKPAPDQPPPAQPLRVGEQPLCAGHQAARPGPGHGGGHCAGACCNHLTHAEQQQQQPRAPPQRAWRALPPVRCRSAAPATYRMTCPRSASHLPAPGLRGA